MHQPTCWQAGLETNRPRSAGERSLEGALSGGGGGTRATEGRVVVQRSTRQHARPGKQVDVLLGGAGSNAVTGSRSVAESPVDGTFRRMDSGGSSGRRVLGSALESQRLFNEAAMELLGELESRKITVATIDDVLVDEENVEALAPLLLAHNFSARYPPLVQVLIDKVAVPHAANHAVPQLAFFIRSVPADYRDPVEAEMVQEDGPTWQERIRDDVGSALGRLVTPNWTDVFLDLARDRDLGGARFEIIRNLSKLRDEGVAEVLLKLLEDRSVDVLAAEALGEMRCRKARSALSKLVLTGDWASRQAVASALWKISVQGRGARDQPPRHRV